MTFCRTERKDEDDAVEVRDDGRRSTETVAPFGLMSQTSTHYQFDTPAPAGLDIGPNAGIAGGSTRGSRLGFWVWCRRTKSRHLPTIGAIAESVREVSRGAIQTVRKTDSIPV